MLDRLIRVDQHPHGPRVYVLGQRVHEVALGLAVLLPLVVLLALRLVRPTDETLLAGALGCWLVAKDWRDLFPRWRNTQVHRRFGFHLRSGAGRVHVRLGAPEVAAAATLAVAAVNAASALTPNVGWRGHLLLRVEPVAALPVFHAVALPASFVLGLTALSLARRRRRALHLAVALLVLLAAADLLKGLDVEEAALSAGLAAALWYGESAFDVRGERLALRRALLPASLSALALAGTGALSVWASGGTDPSMRLAAVEAGALLSWRPAPLPTAEPASLGVHALLALAIVAAAWTLYRPRRPAASTGSDERRRAYELVRRHGRDTLATFKLRSDLQYLFTPDGRAFVGYRIESGVLLVAGDPVGPADALEPMVRRARSFADAHGLRLGAVGASEAFARACRSNGLRALYVGDEAIVDTRAFTLEGRPIRKVRQSVTRLLAAGFVADVVDVARLGPELRAELEGVSARWLRGQPERGFAMATTLDDPAAHEGVVVLARDAEGRVRGWLHFLPSFGRPAMSLALMRRDPATPNGLTEFLVVRAVELLRERGVEEVSLNFAAFARPLRDPRRPFDHVARWLLGRVSRHFQIESLYRFNAKFFPRWEPRYLLYQGAASLPRVGLAALLAEGQLPRPGVLLRRAGASA